MKTRLVRAKLLYTDRHTGRQTDTTKLTVAFRNVVNAPKNETHFLWTQFSKIFWKFYSIHTLKGKKCKVYHTAHHKDPEGQYFTL